MNPRCALRGLAAATLLAPLAFAQERVIYREDFATLDAPTTGGSDPVRVRWCPDGARVDHAGPGSFGAGALRADGPSIDPLIHVWVDESGCQSVILRFKYAQLEETGTQVEFALSDDPRPNCLVATPWRATRLETVGVSGDEVEVHVGLDEHKGVYFRLDHGSNRDALWIDDVEVAVVGCATVRALDDPCGQTLREFVLDFDSPLPTNVRPAGIASWEGMRVGGGAPCGGEEAGLLHLAQREETPPSATTHCIDTRGMGSAHLSIGYTKPLGAPGPSIEASIQGGPFVEIWRAEAFPVLPEQRGRCFWDAVDLAESGVLHVPNLRLRLVGATDTAGVAFDHIELSEGPPPGARVTPIEPELNPEESVGTLRLVVSGDPLLGQALSFDLRGLAHGTSGAMLGASLARAETPLPEGILLLDMSPNQLVLLEEMTPARGGSEARWPAGDQNMVPSLRAFAGRSLYVQALAKDPKTNALRLSNAMEVVFGAGR